MARSTKRIWPVTRNGWYRLALGRHSVTAIVQHHLYRQSFGVYFEPIKRPMPGQLTFQFATHRIEFVFV